MRVLAPVLVAALAASAVPAEAGPRHGKIVRVERPRTAGKGSLRFCRYEGDSSGTAASATCFGQPPRVGEIGTLVTTVMPDATQPATGVRGTARVRTVEATNPSGPGSVSCSLGLWRAELELQADADTSRETYNLWLVFDAGLGPGGRLVDPPAELPSDKNGVQAPITIDRDGDGDGAPEFLVTWYPNNGGSGGSASTHYIVEFWQGGPGHWARFREDAVAWCN